MKSLHSYITSELGLKMSLPKKASDNLIQAQNSTFAKNYKFYEISISGISVIVAQRINGDKFNGTNIAKDFHAMKEYFQFILLIELPVMDAVFRRLLVSKKVNFVVPGHQFYFPELLISFTENNLTKKSSPKTLTISAQVLLLYHLQKKSLAGIPFKEIAELIGYSAKTVTLAVIELCNLGIARVESVGHNKVLQFYKRGAELYNQVDKMLQSPVISSGYTDYDVTKLGLTNVCGTLIYRNDTDSNEYWDYGMTSQKARELGIKVYATPREYSVSVWRYDPALMATDGKADALSILLSLIETCKRDPIPFRGDYESHKKSVLETIKWADIEEAEK